MYGQAPPAALQAELQAFMKSYEDAANRADVTAYLSHYKPSVDLIVVNDGVLARGWNAVKDGANEMMGAAGAYHLALGAVDIVPLGATRALVIAPFATTVTTAGGAVQLRGAMSLVVEKVAARWLIVHDHTSLQPAG